MKGLNKLDMGWRMAIRKMVYATQIPKMKNRIKCFNSPNLLFIWIPKAAGTSIYTWLNEELGMMKLKDKLSIIGAFPQGGPVTFGHMDYCQLLERGIISEHFHVSAFKFAVSRNPFDRCISLYSYLRMQGRINVSFSGFLELLETGFEPIGMYNSRGLSQANPQVRWITNHSGKIIVDKIFKVENLKYETSMLSSHFGIRPFSVYVNKSSERPDYIKVYSDIKNVQRVRRLYREDFDILEYPDKPVM